METNLQMFSIIYLMILASQARFFTHSGNVSFQLFLFLLKSIRCALNSIYLCQNLACLTCLKILYVSLLGTYRSRLQHSIFRSESIIYAWMRFLWSCHTFWFQDGFFSKNPIINKFYYLQYFASVESKWSTLRQIDFKVNLHG